MLKPDSEREATVIAESRAELRKLLQRFEDDLKDKAYLAGESLLDAAVIPRFLRLAHGEQSALPNCLG